MCHASSEATRFVCISDTHNASPRDGCFKLPPGDVLIHAGDLTNQGTFGELKKTIDWIAESEYEVKIVVAGTSAQPSHEGVKLISQVTTISL